MQDLEYRVKRARSGISSYCEFITTAIKDIIDESLEYPCRIEDNGSDVVKLADVLMNWLSYFQ